MAEEYFVTPPRRILPGQICFVTVRAVNRSYRFVPKRDIRHAITYCLAVALHKFDGKLALHEFLWMSNHFHLVLTDTKGCLPAFMEHMNSLISRALNALRGINGANIESGYNIVVVQGEERVLEHCVYTLANPCSAHLVVRSRHWQGVSSLKLDYGTPMRVKRPTKGLWSTEPSWPKAMDPKRASYRGRTTLPAEVDLVLERPSVLLDLSDAELRQHIRQQLDERELALIKERRRKGRGVLGWKAALKTSFLAVPAPENMFGTKPSVSGEEAKARAQAAEARRLFIDAYRAAVVSFMEGKRDVRFPVGTWLMVVRFNVRCVPRLT